jgi:hypothetical protein
MKLTVLDRQSIFDIAIQELGGVEAAFALALENDLSLTDELTTGQPLRIPPSGGGGGVTNYYKNKGLKPATGITDDTFFNIWDSAFNKIFGNNTRIFNYAFELIFE